MTKFYGTPFFFIMLLFLFCVRAAAAGEAVDYRDGPETLEGYWVPAKCETEGVHPVVMVVHQWKGLGDHEKEKSEVLAEQCYDVFAVDMYGKGVRPATNQEAAAEASKYKNDPGKALERINAALDYIRTRTGDTAPVAAIGYCFGGGVVLDFARSGADVRGVVSFHGALSSRLPPPGPGSVRAAIQVHNGAADPHVPPAQVQAFKDEMSAAQADWQFTDYAGAVHAFTDRRAGNDPSSGAAYDERADRRSWAAMTAFLKEVFRRGG